MPPKKPSLSRPAAGGGVGGGAAVGGRAGAHHMLFSSPGAAGNRNTNNVNSTNTGAGGGGSGGLDFGITGTAVSAAARGPPAPPPVVSPPAHMHTHTNTAPTGATTTTTAARSVKQESLSRKFATPINNTHSNNSNNSHNSGGGGAPSLSSSSSLLFTSANTAAANNNNNSNLIFNSNASASLRGGSGGSGGGGGGLHPSPPPRHLQPLQHPSSAESNHNNNNNNNNNNNMASGSRASSGSMSGISQNTITSVTNTTSNFNNHISGTAGVAATAGGVGGVSVGYSSPILGNNNNKNNSGSNSSFSPTGLAGSLRGGRAGRLLRDARAAVQEPFRPETPMEYLGSGDGGMEHDGASAFAAPASPFFNTSGSPTSAGMLPPSSSSSGLVLRPGGRVSAAALSSHANKGGISGPRRPAGRPNRLAPLAPPSRNGSAGTDNNNNLNNNNSNSLSNITGRISSAESGEFSSPRSHAAAAAAGATIAKHNLDIVSSGNGHSGNNAASLPAAAGEFDQSSFLQRLSEASAGNVLSDDSQHAKKRNEDEKSAAASAPEVSSALSPETNASHHYHYSTRSNRRRENAAELALLKELRKWLLRPSNQLWGELLDYMARYLSKASEERYGVSYSDDAESEEKEKNESAEKAATAALIHATNIYTAIAMLSIILHSTHLSCLADQTTATAAGGGATAAKTSSSSLVSPLTKTAAPKNDAGALLQLLPPSHYVRCVLASVRLLRLVLRYERSAGFVHLQREGLTDPLLFIMQHIPIASHTSRSVGGDSSSSSSGSGGEGAVWQNEEILYTVVALLEDCTSQAHDMDAEATTSSSGDGSDSDSDDGDDDRDGDGGVNDNDGGHRTPGRLGGKSRTASASAAAAVVTTADVISSLIKLGLIPALNRAARRLMALDTDAADGDITPTKYKPHHAARAGGKDEGNNNNSNNSNSMNNNNVNEGHLGAKRQYSTQPRDMPGARLLPLMCLTYRHISVDYSRYLESCGSLEVLASALLTYRHQPVPGAAAGPPASAIECSAGASVAVAAATTTTTPSVVEAASRALAKLVFEPLCAESLQRDTSFLRTAVSVLYCQLEAHRELLESALRSSTASAAAPAQEETNNPNNNNSSSSGNNAEASAGRAPDAALRLQRCHLVVARLCTVIAKVCEGRAELRDFLATQGEASLLPALAHFFLHPSALTNNSGNSSATAAGVGNGLGSGGSGEAGAVVTAATAAEATDLSLVQSIMWVMGSASRSPHCSPVLALALLEPITQMLKDAELTRDNRDTVLYTLMCLSNLSFYFPQLEEMEAAGGHYAITAAAAGGGGATDTVDQHNSNNNSTNTDKERNSPPSRLAALFDVLGMILAGFLFDGDAEAAVEATRALGNLSFTNAGRDWMEANKCDEVAVIFLGHEDLRVVYNCFGVVLNLCAGTRCRLVEDPELLALLLRQTQRFTTTESVAAAAREEQRLLLAQQELQRQREAELKQRQQQQQKMLSKQKKIKKQQQKEQKGTKTTSSAAAGIGGGVGTGEAAESKKPKAKRGASVSGKTRRSSSVAGKSGATSPKKNTGGGGDGGKRKSSQSAAAATTSSPTAKKKAKKSTKSKKDNGSAAEGPQVMSDADNREEVEGDVEEPEPVAPSPVQWSSEITPPPSSRGTHNSNNININTNIATNESVYNMAGDGSGTAGRNPNHHHTSSNSYESGMQGVVAAAPLLTEEELRRRTAEAARGYAEQVADLVEMVLANIKGLIDLRRIGGGGGGGGASPSLGVSDARRLYEDTCDDNDAPVAVTALNAADD